MKKTTHILFTALILSFVFVSAAGAHCGMCGLPKKGEDYVAKKVEKLTTLLELTDEQVPQVEALIKEKMEKKQTIKDEQNEKMDAVKDEYSEKVKAVLTDEQKAKYDAMHMDKGSMKGSDHEHKGPGSDMESMDEEKGN